MLGKLPEQGGRQGKAPLKVAKLRAVDEGDIGGGNLVVEVFFRLVEMDEQGVLLLRKLAGKHAVAGIPLKVLALPHHISIE